MKEGQAIKVVQGFGHPDEIPGFVKREGHHVERVELHYSVNSRDPLNKKVNYQYWFFENGDAIAIHELEIAGYNGSKYTVENGIKEHQKDLESIAHQINPNLHVSVIQRNVLDYPSKIPFKG
ncbi:hypothetical protein ISS08_00635 [Candidatus Pacearchaeota archaeon]|nr:hypothetical protein [Candidatus Pacearchaeota archaeon]